MVNSPEFIEAKNEVTRIRGIIYKQCKVSPNVSWEYAKAKCKNSPHMKALRAAILKMKEAHQKALGERDFDGLYDKVPDSPDYGEYLGPDITSVSLDRIVEDVEDVE